MILLTPGPTPILEEVRLAMATPTFHHRTPEFEAIFAQARDLYKSLFGYEDVVFLSSSGTGAMQSALQFFCKSKALCVNAGKFGERFVKIAKHLGIAHHELKYAWNECVQVQDVLEILKADLSIDAVFLQACETSSGTRHPVEDICQAIKAHRPSIVTVVDGITAVGADELDNTHLDVVINGSQKALQLPPGMSMMGFGAYALSLLEKDQSSHQDFYFDLPKEWRTQMGNTTAYTPTTTIILGLVVMLKKIQAFGLSNVYIQTAKLSKATKAALQSLGIASYPNSPGVSLSVGYHDDASAIIKQLKQDHGVHLAGGQDHLKGKIFRINHMGFVPVQEVLFALNAIEVVLDKLGKRSYDGSACKAFTQHYYAF